MARNVDVTACIVDVDLNVNTSGTTKLSGIGGVLGYAENVKIEKCANIGSINGGTNGQYVGGLAGYLASGKIVIEDSYNRGSVTAPGKGYSGGIVGFMMLSNSDSYFKNCYNTGNISGSANIGAIVGYLNEDNYSLTTRNVYYLNTSCVDENEMPIGAGNVNLEITAKTDEEMKSAEFVDLLNDGRTGDDAVWTQSDTYPIFTFQTEPSTPSVAVTPSGDAFVLGENYSVDGNVVTVTFDVPCKVGYLGEDGKYVAIEAAAVEGQENTYTFTAPEGVTDVVLVIKGDANLDGEFTNLDVTIAKAASLGREVTFTDIGMFAADMTNDGEFTNYDVTLLKAVSLGKYNYEW